MGNPLGEQLTFGLRSMLPEDAKVAWGARWIVAENWAYRQWCRRGRGRRPKQYQVEFVFDRQSMAGEETEVEAFKKELNKGGQRNSATVKALREAERLFNCGEWELRCGSARSAGPKVLFRDARLEIVGDPRSSGGYIYVVAYRRTAPSMAPQQGKKGEE